MTLIAGFVCPDGFVIAGDTEITLDDICFQATKILGSPGTDTAYRLVLGGAGHTAYLDEVMQEIVEKTSDVKEPLLAQVDHLIRKVINRIHDENLFKHWAPGDLDRPRLELIAGLRDVRGEIGVWKSEDKAVSRVATSTFAGSGVRIASYLGEKLFRAGMPTAIVHHLAGQILREAKVKGTGVGGNTDTWSVRTQQAAPYFDIALGDQQYLWGVEEVLLSAARCALEGRAHAVGDRIAFVTRRLAEIQQAASKPLDSQGDQWHTIEITQAELNPFGDF